MTGWHKAFKECLKLYTPLGQKKGMPATIFSKSSLEFNLGIKKNLTNVMSAADAANMKVSSHPHFHKNERRQMSVSGDEKWNWDCAAWGHSGVQLQGRQSGENAAAARLGGKLWYCSSQAALHLLHQWNQWAVTAASHLDLGGKRLRRLSTAACGGK